MVGTMIGSKGCTFADQIAETRGISALRTNELTQMTWGYPVMMPAGFLQTYVATEKRWRLWHFP